MLALQLRISGGHDVTSNGVSLGELKIKPHEGLEVLRLYQDEFCQQLVMIKEYLLNLKQWNIKQAVLYSDSLLVSMTQKQNILPYIDAAIYPMQSNGLSVNWQKCNNSWVIKMSVVNVRKELQSQGVIK
jgi:hypothetical protein